MSEETISAPELIPANVDYMQEMMYVAQGYADWDETFNESETIFDDDLEGV